MHLFEHFNECLSKVINLVADNSTSHYFALVVVEFVHVNEQIGSIFSSKFSRFKEVVHESCMIAELGFETGFFVVSDPVVVNDHLVGKSAAGVVDKGTHVQTGDNWSCPAKESETEQEFGVAGDLRVWVVRLQFSFFGMGMWVGLECIFREEGENEEEEKGS